MSTGRWRWKNFPVPEVHLGFIGAGMILDQVLPGEGPSSSPARRYGWSLILTGFAIAAWATLAAGGDDLEHPPRVVATGPYRLSRNPMYLGWDLICLGCALVARSRWMTWLFPGLLIASHRVVLGEESRLRSLLGESYEAYARDVPRYLRLSLPPTKHS